MRKVISIVILRKGKELRQLIFHHSWLIFFLFLQLGISCWRRFGWMPQWPRYKCLWTFWLLVNPSCIIFHDVWFFSIRGFETTTFAKKKTQIISYFKCYLPQTLINNDTAIYNWGRGTWCLNPYYNKRQEKVLNNI